MSLTTHTDANPMPPKRRKKTPTEKNKHVGTLAHRDLCIFPGRPVVVETRNPSILGMLRIFNLTDRVIHLPGSAQCQRELGCAEITGDELPAHSPIGWGHGKEVAFQVLKVNADLCAGGKREMSPGALKTLMAPEGRWTMEQLVTMIPAIPGSEYRQLTAGNYLGYRRCMWTVKHQLEVSGTVSASLVLRVRTGACLSSPYTCANGERAIVAKDAIQGQPVAFVLDSTAQVPDVPTPCDPSLDAFLVSIGTSGLVSLLQKAVRRRPAALKHPETGVVYETEEVVRQVVRRLLSPSQTGIFLADRGIYVSARQHLLKRLLVIAAEDSEYGDANMSLLATAALLSECDASWAPDAGLCARWEDIAVSLWASSKTSTYNTAMGFSMGPTTFANFEPAHLACMVHEELGGMTGDRGMLRWLRSSARNTVVASGTVQHVDSLDIYCDQHITGCVGYLWNARRKPGPASAPYEHELAHAFRIVSGWNTRRKPLPDTYSMHQNAILAAMKEASRQIRGIGVDFPTGQTTSYEWEIPRGTLAGLLQPVEVFVDSKALLVTVDPNDLTRLVVIPKPSRSSALKDITSSQRARAVHKARAVLSRGVRIQGAPHASLEKKNATFDGDTWRIDGVEWANARRVVSDVLQVPTTVHTDGHLPWERPHAFEPSVVQWVVGRLSGFEPVITMPRVGRDGAGTKEALTGLEGRAYSLMCLLARQCPDALWPEPAFRFRTRCIALRHELRDKLMEQQTTAASPFVEWRDTRTLRSLQQDALDGMLKADAEGMGNFLWMLVGSGKTLTVLTFLHRTRRVAKCLWCLPMSAMQSVAKEIRKVGWPVRVLASSKSRLRHVVDFTSKKERTLKRTLAPGVVTLVEHDDVRNMVSDLARQMTETAFIYDEVHKAMASRTQRTAAALRLASVARQMVALTGTPIVSSKAISLIQWLRFCVPFQVHARNFWVAANAMIAKLASTPVRIDAQQVSVPIPPGRAQELYANLPARHGGIARKPNWQKAYDVSVDIVDEYLVAETRKLVYAPRGPPPEGCPLRQTFSCEHAWAVAATRKLPPSAELRYHLPQRVLLVAADNRHAAKLINDLVDAGTPPADIQLVGGRKRPENMHVDVTHAKTVCYTPEEFRSGQNMPKICVAPIAYCEGYSLTWMTCMVTGVYPSNQAKRTQMEGRINRTDCERLHRTYIIAMAGLTEIMFRYHRNAKNLEKALANISSMDS